MCASGGLLCKPAGSNYLFFAAFLADFFLPPFFAAFFFPPFLVAILSSPSFPDLVFLT
jgi:hypothetical protein